MYRGPPGGGGGCSSDPSRAHGSPQPQPQRQGSHRRDASPLKKTFPSCDPAPAWESARDRP